MLFGVPQAVKSFFRPVVVETSKPIRRALPVMVLALLLAPHRRCLKTLAGMVLGHREHVATISRRLRNRLWKTLDWYTRLFAGLLAATDRWERRAARGQRRQWMVVIDTTYHGTLSECMENLLHMSRRRSANRRSTGQHAFVMGLLLTDKGGRLPLPRKSYYTQDYCRKKRRKYRSLNDLAAAMIRDVPTPDDVEVRWSMTAPLMPSRCMPPAADVVFARFFRWIRIGTCRRVRRSRPKESPGRRWSVGRGRGPVTSLPSWNFRSRMKTTSSSVAVIATT